MRKLDDSNELRNIEGGAKIITYCPNYFNGCFKAYKKTDYFFGSCKFANGKESSSSKYAWILAGQIHIARAHMHGCHEYDCDHII